MIPSAEYHGEVTEMQSPQLWGGFSIPRAPKREVNKSIHCHTGKRYPVVSFRQHIIHPVLTVIKNLMQEHSLQTNKQGSTKVAP